MHVQTRTFLWLSEAHFCFHLSNLFPLISAAQIMNTPFPVNRATIIRVVILFVTARQTGAEALPIVRGVQLQPIAAQIARVAQALELCGAPLGTEPQAALKAGSCLTDEAGAVERSQQGLDPLCVGEEGISPERRVKVQAG